MATVAETFALAFQHHQAGNQHLAEQLYRQVIQADPQHADAHHLLGVLAHQTGRHDMAIASINRALALNPRGEIYHSNLGLALQAADRMEEAVTSFRQAVRLNPNFADAHNALGNALRVQGHLAEAVMHCREALRLNPRFADAHNNLGNALNLQDKTEEAVAHYREALRLIPNFALAHANLGNALTSLGQFDEALKANERALQLQPDSALAHWNRSLLWLLLGDFQRGWPEYEWRRTQYKSARRQFPQPLWDGSALAGRRILLYAEQGLGDTIQFIRYAPLVKQRGGTVIVECQSSLQRLLAGAAGIDQLVAHGATLPAFDVQAGLLCLPGIFHTSLTTIPAPVPYLQADSRLQAIWRKQLNALEGFKVGIAWQGNPSYPGDNKRSIALAHFAPIAAVPGVRIISLQKGPGTEQLGATADRFSVVDFGQNLDETAGPFMDTAAIINNLDLVISSDTVIPHLAGALGIPVWLALPFVPDWRWQLQREDCQWYPTMRLFRQHRHGDWEGVFQRMATALAGLANPGNKV